MLSFLFFVEFLELSDTSVIEFFVEFVPLFILLDEFVDLSVQFVEFLMLLRDAFEALFVLFPVVFVEFRIFVLSISIYLTNQTLLKQISFPAFCQR